MWLNESEIRQLADTHRTHKVLGPATKFLLDYMEEVNAHSDGWPYWQAATRPARQLQAFILLHQHNSWPKVAEPTMADVRKAIAPIRAFMTRKGTAAGMTLPLLHFK